MAKWPYGDRRWGEIRRLALIRDGFACQICRRTTADGVIIDVDHIHPAAKRPDLAFSLANTRTLCRPHHHERTHGRRHSRKW